jgi:hypothetical protein
MAGMNARQSFLLQSKCRLLGGHGAFDKIETVLTPITFAINDVPRRTEDIGSCCFFGKTIKLGLHAGGLG